MSKIQMFEVLDTRRYTEEGREVILNFRFDFPPKAINYFNKKSINSFKIDMQNRKSIVFYMNTTLSFMSMLNDLKDCCESFMSDYTFDETNFGTDFVVSKKEDSTTVLKTIINNQEKETVKPLESNSGQIKLEEKSLAKALENEDYLKAAKHRDKILALKSE